MFYNFSGPTRWAERHSNTVSDSFLLFFPPHLIDGICKWTNKEGCTRHGDKWKDLNSEEMKKYIGQLILVGVFKAKNEDVNELYSAKMGRPIFGRVMSRDRFRQITSALRFDDAEKRRKHRSPDKLGPIRDIFEEWNKTLRDNAYVLGWAVTVDEQLVTFRGRCPFRQYIPSKPGKYGIKFWVLSDAATGYVWKIEVYKGKKPEEVREVGQGERVVKSLVAELVNTGRNVTCNDFFTSLPLARFLLTKNLTIVGTIRKNKAELPPEFTITKGREVHSTLFGFQDDVTIASYCPKKHKIVTLLSTLHDDAQVDGLQKKPAIITTYNETKAGVDKADQKLRHFSVKRKTRRWPMAVFSNMIDISALNAFIIYISLHPDDMGTKSGKRRKFLIQLGLELVGVTEEEPAAVDLQSKPYTFGKAAVRKRCQLCPRKKNRASKVTCMKCGKHTCGEHSRVICQKCS